MEFVVFVYSVMARFEEDLFEGFSRPKLKSKVEFALHRNLPDELTDEEFKEGIQAILVEFKGKNLLHQNIGQLTWRMEKENPCEKNKFEKIWILLDQVS